MQADHLTEGEISGYLDGDLSVAERTRVEQHMEACAECRAEVVDVMRTAGDVRPQPAASRPRRGYRWAGGIGVAAAAGIAAIMILRPDTSVGPADAQRAPASVSESRRTIAVVAPAEAASVPRDRLAFTWRAAGADLYRVSIVSESGDPVWTAETGDTSIAVPPTVALHGGATYYWRVEGVAAGITASTGARAFRMP